jgi:hypothetical protein
VSAFKYIQCDPHLVPRGTRFDVPGVFAGQAIEVAYGGPMEQPEHTEGAPWKRTIDKSELLCGYAYYRLCK